VTLPSFGALGWVAVWLQRAKADDQQEEIWIFSSLLAELEEGKAMTIAKRDGKLFVLPSA
jgi:hypothetical protein